MKTENNYAFIDGNNLYLGAKAQGIDLDYRKLRLYLTHKFSISKAFIFIGYDPERTGLYASLHNAGFILVHKPTVKYYEDGKQTMKGNVDAELVLHCAAIEYGNYDKAVIITSDGDFRCLIDFLKDRGKLERIITPTKFYSSLLQEFRDSILSLSAIRKIIS